MKQRALGFTLLEYYKLLYKSIFMEKDFKEYHEFVKSMKVYPEKHAIIYPALGLCGEAGEFAEKVKKYLRGDGDGVLDKDACLKELGDVLWYVCSAADDLGFTLQDVVNRNVEKLQKRTETGTRKGSGDNREDISYVKPTTITYFDAKREYLAKGETSVDIKNIGVEKN